MDAEKVDVFLVKVTGIGLSKLVPVAYRSAVLAGLVAEYFRDDRTQVGGEICGPFKADVFDRGDMEPKLAVVGKLAYPYDSHEDEYVRVVVACKRMEPGDITSLANSATTEILWDGGVDSINEAAAARALERKWAELANVELITPWKISELQDVPSGFEEVAS